MTVQSIRLECLKLADPKVQGADVAQWISTAKKLEEYVTGEGQGAQPPKKRRGRPPTPRADTPATAGPAKDQSELV